MRKLIFTVVATIISVTAFSQSLAGTEWNGWDKGGFEKQESSSSGNVSDVTMPNVSTVGRKVYNDMLSKALESSLVIIKQQYRLEKDGTWWGNNGMDYFGQTVSLGIKVSGGLLFTDKVISPWKYDSNFDDVDRSYKPFVYDSFIKAFGADSYDKTNLELESKFVSPFATNKQGNDESKSLEVFFHEDSKASFGLPLIDSTELNESVVGYQVWVYSDDSMSGIEISEYVFDSQDHSDVGLTARMTDNLVGGLALTVAFQPGGRIQLQLIGVAVQDPDSNGWKMLSVTKK